MHLHPDAQRVLDMIKASGRPPLDSLTPAEARLASAASRPILSPDAPEVGAVADFDADGIPVRCYRGLGTAPASALPCLVYYHGGGWVIGDLDSHDYVCRRLANDAACCVISVHYRLAPEHVFPAAVDDSAAALRWIASNAAALAIDPARIAVGGDSAGGNLATVMAIMARDGTVPPIGFQLLVYPVTDLSATHASYDRITSGYPLTTTTMKWFRGLYLRDRADEADWRASPLRAASLAGLAPAFILTCRHDPLCDEGLDYAARLEREGVAVTLMHLSDQMHAFLTMGRVIRAADSALSAMAASLRAAWGMHA